MKSVGHQGSSVRGEEAGTGPRSAELCSPPSDLDDPRVIAAVQEYMAALECGDNVSRSEFLHRHADIAGALAVCLAGLEFVHQAASGLHTSALHPPMVAGPANAEALLGTPLGDFRILREIGRGGMGVVYEAEQISLGRRVALKLLPFAAALDSKQLQRFRNEAQAAAHLHHTNIVPVYAVGCERGVHYYAMQCIEGQTVAAVIRELRQLAGLEEANPSGSAQPANTLTSELLSGRWAPAKQGNGQAAKSNASERTTDFSPAGPPPHQPTARTLQASAPPAHDITPSLGARSTDHSMRSRAYFRTVAHLGAQAAEALEHAHVKGIIHRDIKPANLLVDGSGNVWITDFGLARMLSEAGLTMTGDLLGTLRYMSPEQALAKRVPVDHRTDIYSLGVTLYELLTLRPAYDGRDRQEIMQQIAFEEPRPPRRFNKAIPADLETILQKAIDKNLSERYASAQELADDLRRYLEDKPIKARRPTLQDRAAKWARRHKTVVRAAVLLLVVAMIGSAVSAFLIMQQRDVAEANRLRAEQILDTAYRSLDKMYLAWAEKHLPQATELSSEDRQFLEDALTFYMEFAKQDSSEAKAGQKAADAYLRVATIQSQLQQEVEAKRTYRQALEAFRKLAVEFPDNHDYLCSLGRCLSNMADMGWHPLYFDTIEENREAFRQAIKIQERLVAADPARTQYRRDLAESYSRLAGHFKDYHTQYDEAEALCRSARTILSRLIEEHPTEVTYRQDLCDLLGRLAAVWMETGRLKQAGQLFQESLELRKRLVQDFPGETYPRYCLGWGYDNLGQWQQTYRRVEDAAASYRQAVDIRRKLVADFAGVRLYRQHLARSYGDLGWALSQLRRVDEAEQNYREALSLLQSPGWDHLFMDCVVLLAGRTRCNLGHLKRDQGEVEAALVWYDQAIATAKKVTTKESQPVARDLLGCASGGRMVALLALRRFKEAEQGFKELEKCYREALKLDPANHWYWFQDAPLRLQRGDLEGYRTICREMLARFGRTDDPLVADRTARTCLLVPAAVADLGSILQMADQTITGNDQKFDYCWYLLLKGMAEYRSGHFDQAIALLNQTLSLGREARYFNSRSLSGTAYAFLAMAHQRLGQGAKARQALDLATELLHHPYSKIGSNWSIDENWGDWLRFYLIRQEAETLVTGKAVPMN